MLMFYAIFNCITFSLFVMARSILYTLLFFLYIGNVAFSKAPASKIIWQIGASDNSPIELALAPDGFKNFLENDFGWEDGWFLVGTSVPAEDWPYVLPGPADRWGGTSGTAGWRSHVLNALFELTSIPDDQHFKLVVDLFDFNASNPPLVKISLNGSSWKYFLPNEGSDHELPDSSSSGHEFLIEIPIDPSIINEGGNELRITTLQGSWISFDQVRLEGPESCKVIDHQLAFVRSVKAADYEIELHGKTFQPLLVDIEHVKGSPELKVLLITGESRISS